MFAKIMKHNSVIKEIIEGVLQGIGIGAIIWCTILYFTGDNKLNDVKKSIVSIAENSYFVGCNEGLRSELNIDRKLATRICKPAAVEYSKYFKDLMEKE